MELQNKIERYIFFLAALLILLGDFVLTVVTYTVVGALLIGFSLYILKSTKLKIISTLMYIILIGMQINTVIFTNPSFGINILRILMLYLSFLVLHIMDLHEYYSIYFPAVDLKNTVSFSEIIYSKNTYKDAITKFKKASDILDAKTIKEISKEIARNNSLSYTNQYSLDDTYFDKAYATLDDEHIYMIVSDTGSAASSVLSIFTDKRYNHISISFDSDLSTIISYNGGEKVYPPGLNEEIVEFFHKKKGASILVYQLAVTREQKKQMIEVIRKINKEGSAYNLLGLGLTVDVSAKPNIMYCSQFVYYLLKEVDAHYFESENKKIKPTDFIELDYYRKLSFKEKVVFS